MWMEISHRKNKKVWFRVDTNCRYSPLSCYKFSVSITIFLPILRASDFPWSVCIQHAFDLHPVPCECVFSVCFPQASECRLACLGAFVSVKVYLSQLFSGLWNRKVRLTVSHGDVLQQCLFCFQRFVSLELLGESAKHGLHPPWCSVLLCSEEDAAIP